MCKHGVERWTDGGTGEYVQRVFRNENYPVNDEQNAHDNYNRIAFFRRVCKKRER